MLLALKDKWKQSFKRRRLPFCIPYLCFNAYVGFFSSFASNSFHSAGNMVLGFTLYSCKDRKGLTLFLIPS